ncbi:hypothetical protein [Aggregatibacter actinomycetemcomitans]|uniref:hypothetical protein n=1 Tax=Aggregatibacter actinomycetemcomitans TaxID=714 RepID=UPI0011DD127C|nr:hypothetical protein [Aggregatibacter actinomycetemcomitans]QEH44956.1 hypothetical protein FXN58_04705 [Aggregatibacter actinomycetemcomitans]QEH47023.1 hypothetical protein FXN59_04815 [Aggregatibacter actinomycetemcomitans]QEH49189.1 hypothetical protein FXN57_05650 [Aggregatibacter actinomycetemcomitans]
MNYYGINQPIKLGDAVVYAGEIGGIVAIIEDDLYTNEYSKENWSYLEKGFLTDINEYRLLHFVEPNEDLVLLSRK